jgi:hypothetical protein
MFHWIEAYYRGFHFQPSNRMKPPPPNFFQPKGNSRYKSFLQKTIDLSNSAVLLEELDEGRLQRSPINSNLFYDQEGTSS